MPWQELVADVGCEMVQDRRSKLWLPAYNEVIVTVPRQSGKTTLFLSWQIDRCVNIGLAPDGWGKPQRSAFTAQSGKDARDKWLDEMFPLIQQSPLDKLVADYNRGMGNEAIHFKTGSLIRILSTSTSAGHSKTLDQAVMDEVWHDVDDRREQGLRPAMITRRNRQLLVCSTAGTNASTVLNRKVEIGRNAVAEDSGTGIAYFEWSAPDEWEPGDDPETWWEFMPALGHTISPESIEAERQSMDAGEFRRAYGNRPTAGADVVFPAEVWARVNSATAKPEGQLRFGLDVAEDRSSAAIVVSGANGVLELVDHRPGLEWVVERSNELTTKHSAKVAVDTRGPAGPLVDYLKNVEQKTSLEVLQACGSMFDAIVEAQVMFRQDAAFDAAVEGAVKKPVGDLFAWSRKASTADVTPFMAATLAFRPKKAVTSRVINLSDIPDEEGE